MHAEQIFKITRDRLRAITKGCREDMHEPDEQGLSARIVGNKLDNGFGETIDPQAIIGGYQEFVVILDRGGETGECFNLADLIALARRANVGSAP